MVGPQCLAGQLSRWNAIASPKFVHSFVRLVMEYIDEDCMTDASDPSYPTPFFPYEKYWRTVFTDNELTDTVETDSYYSALLYSAVP